MPLPYFIHCSSMDATRLSSDGRLTVAAAANSSSPKATIVQAFAVRGADSRAKVDFGVHLKFPNPADPSSAVMRYDDDFTVPLDLHVGTKLGENIEVSVEEPVVELRSSKSSAYGAVELQHIPNLNQTLVFLQEESTVIGLPHTSMDYCVHSGRVLLKPPPNFQTFIHEAASKNGLFQQLLRTPGNSKDVLLQGFDLKGLEIGAVGVGFRYRFGASNNYLHVVLERDVVTAKVGHRVRLVTNQSPTVDGGASLTAAVAAVLRCCSSGTTTSVHEGTVVHALSQAQGLNGANTMTLTMERKAEDGWGFQFIHGSTTIFSVKPGSPVSEAVKYMKMKVEGYRVHRVDGVVTESLAQVTKELKGKTSANVTLQKEFTRRTSRRPTWTKSPTECWCWTAASP